MFLKLVFVFRTHYKPPFYFIVSPSSSHQCDYHQTINVEDKLGYLSNVIADLTGPRRHTCSWRLETEQGTDTTTCGHTQYDLCQYITHTLLS